MLSVMAEAAQTHEVPLLRLSFAGTQAALRQFSPRLLAAGSKKKRKALLEELLRVIAADKVPERKGRREPRAVKRRRKPYPMLNKPRSKYRDIPHSKKYRKNQGEMKTRA